MGRRHQLLLSSKHILAHVVHLIVVLLPTLALAGPRGISWSVACFALGISIAAILESQCVVQDSCVADAIVHDTVAMRVALFVGTCLLVLFWVAQIECYLQHRTFAWLQAAGLCCLATGIVLRTAAIRTLGGQFVSDIRVRRTRVRHGIYAWLRHPSEVGLLLFAVGGPLLLGAPWTATAATILLLPVSLWRVHREDVAWTE